MKTIGFKSRGLRRYASMATLSVTFIIFMAAITSRADILYVSEADGTIDKYDTTDGASEGVFADTSSGLGIAQALALDSSGDLYVANNALELGPNDIMKFTPAGVGSVVTTTVGNALPLGIALDNSGNIFVSGFGTNAIQKYSSSGTFLSNVNSQYLNTPIGMAVNKSGDLFVASWANGNIVRIVGGASQVVASVGTGPWDVAFDPAGDMFVANVNATNVEEFPVSGPSKIVANINNGLDDPGAVACDSEGDLFIANRYANTIMEVATNGTISTFADLSSLPYDLAIEPVPEPGVLFLSSVGVLGMIAVRFCNRRRPVRTRKG